MNEKKGKIVDEKGKLFGKINLIDLLVILLVLAVAAVLVLKVFGKNTGLPGTDVKEQIEYTVKVPQVQEAVFKAVQEEVKTGGESAQLMANGEMLDGYVISVSAEPHLEPVNMEDGSIVSSAQPGYVDVNVTIRTAISNPITQAVGTQEVRIGKTHIVKTKNFELVNGIIQSCQVVEPQA